MREIRYIAVHCTGGNQKATIRDLELEFQLKGWKNPGYHYVITADGRICQMLDDEKISNGVKGFNGITINVCYTGGVDAEGTLCDTRTSAQKKSLRGLLKVLRKRYPNAIIQGHRDFSKDLNGNGIIEENEWMKQCPCFDAKTEYQDI